MTKVSVFIATSLDGFIARKDGRLDWLEEANARVTPGEDCGFKEFFSSIDLLIMGRKTFETVAKFDQWPYLDKPVVVLSRTLTKVPEHLPKTISLSALTPAEVLKQTAAGGTKNVYVDGGATIQSFLAADLVDELIVTTIPVLLGDGIRLFAELPADIWLEHLHTKSYPFGFVQSRYQIKK